MLAHVRALRIGALILRGGARRGLQHRGQPLGEIGLLRDSLPVSRALEWPWAGGGGVPLVTLGSGGAGRAFSCADPELSDQVRSSPGVREAGAGGRVFSLPPLGRAPAQRPRPAPPRPLSALSSPSAAPAAAALAMGAQDRPQCHFDIEINREPGERGVLRAGRARAGGRTSGRLPLRPCRFPGAQPRWSAAKLPCAVPGRSRSQAG